MKRLGLALIAMSMAMTTGVFAQAPAQNEVEALQRIANEIERIKPLIVQASQVQDKTRRTLIRYDLILKDLNVVQHGVQDAMYEPDTTPREVAPLQGQYSY